MTKIERKTNICHRYVYSLKSNKKNDIDEKKQYRIEISYTLICCDKSGNLVFHAIERYESRNEIMLLNKNS